jgi:hypothetical protein
MPRALTPIALMTHPCVATVVTLRLCMKQRKK